VFANGLFNHRQLNLLPGMLVRAGRGRELRTLLLGLPWLQACLFSLSASDLLTQFTAVLPVVPLARYTGRTPRLSLYIPPQASGHG